MKKCINCKHLFGKDICYFCNIDLREIPHPFFMGGKKCPCYERCAKKTKYEYPQNKIEGDTIMKKNKTLTGLKALDDIRECGEWIPVDATAIIRKELIEFEELKQMEQELGISFKELCLFLKEGFTIEFNGKNVVAHSKKP